MIKNSSFKVRILQIFISITLIQALAITVTFYYRTSDIVYGLSEKISNEMMDKIQERVGKYFTQPASLTRITRSIVKWDSLIEDHQFLWYFMWQPLLMTEQLESFFIADRNGNYVQVRRFPKLATRIIDRSKSVALDTRLYRTEEFRIIKSEFKETSFDPRVRPWYVNTGLEQKYYWTDAYIGTTSQKPVVACSYPIVEKNYEDDIVKTAVICVNIPLEALSNFLKQQKISKNGLVFFTDNSDQIVAYPDMNNIIIKEKETNNFRLLKFSELKEPYLKDIYNRYESSGQFKFVSVTERKKYFVNIKKISADLNMDWKMVIIIPESDLLSGVYNIVITIIVMFSIIFMLSIIAIYFITNSISKPIVKLAALNDQIKDFNLDFEEEICSSIYEINKMHESINNAATGLKAFRKYVPADLVRQLIKSGQEVDVGGEPETLTILFTDIEGFTSISEQLSADFLMRHLSEYFDHLSSLIMSEKGTIDKYIGDSIMAFWGAPVRQSDSAVRACRGALLCQEKLIELNHHWNSFNKPVMNTRIGIATGRVVVGNVGSSCRLNYSVIGDSVNLASRLEGINDVYGTTIIINKQTYNEVKDHFHCRILDIVAVAGKKNGSPIYELMGDKSTELAPIKREFKNCYEKGFHAYLKKDWVTALKYFTYLKNKENTPDKSVDLFYERCHFFRKHPNKLPENWNGVTRFTKK